MNPHPHTPSCCLIKVTSHGQKMLLHFTSFTCSGLKKQMGSFRLLTPRSTPLHSQAQGQLLRLITRPWPSWSVGGGGREGGGGPAALCAKGTASGAKALNRKRWPPSPREWGTEAAEFSCCFWQGGVRLRGTFSSLPQIWVSNLLNCRFQRHQLPRKREINPGLTGCHRPLSVEAALHSDTLLSSS